ncbi:MAG: septum formation protein Maf [Bacteroidales bacterium]|nr:septum formation protein Maf [Bacteroidales bacterium]
MNILLASKSPRRRTLISALGYDVQAVDVDAEETVPDGLAAVEVVQSIALSKSLAAERFLTPDAVLLTADTIVVYDNRIMGKPADAEEARMMLHTLSGRWHEVYTGVCLAKCQGGSVLRTEFAELTRVHFRSLTAKEIDSYISTGAPMDKAGGYGIQDPFGIVSIDRIEGDYYNVVGLPVARIATELSRFGS